MSGTEWMLTTAEIESVAAFSAGRIEEAELRRQLDERGWPLDEADELVGIVAKERQS